MDGLAATLLQHGVDKLHALHPTNVALEEEKAVVGANVHAAPPLKEHPLHPSFRGGGQRHPRIAVVQPAVGDGGARAEARALAQHSVSLHRRRKRLMKLQQKDAVGREMEARRDAEVAPPERLAHAPDPLRPPSTLEEERWRGERPCHDCILVGVEEGESLACEAVAESLLRVEHHHLSAAQPVDHHRDGVVHVEGVVAGEADLRGADGRPA